MWTWTKLVRGDESTYPPPYKRLLCCSVMPEHIVRGEDIYKNMPPFQVRRTKYDLFVGVFMPDYRAKKYPDMKDICFLRLRDDYGRNVTTWVEYWQLAPEPPIEINDTFEETFRKETV